MRKTLHIRVVIGSEGAVDGLPRRYKRQCLFAELTYRFDIKPLIHRENAGGQ
jgi:hypothetical protein